MESMKKTIILVLLIVGLGACNGVSKEERDKQIADSIANADTSTTFSRTDSSNVIKTDTCKVTKECKETEEVKKKCNGK